MHIYVRVLLSACHKDEVTQRDMVSVLICACFCNLSCILCVVFMHQYPYQPHLIQMYIKNSAFLMYVWGWPEAV